MNQTELNKILKDIKLKIEKIPEHLEGQEAFRPFIEFPQANTVRDWIQVAKDLERVINHLLADKAERVEVRYVDRRFFIESSQRDYGLDVLAFRTAPKSK
jgi:hypothetical protein